MATDDELSQAVDLRKAQILYHARNGSVKAMLLQCRPGYEMEWFHGLIAKYVGKFLRKEISRLMIFVPPQHGKSEIVSRVLPAQILGMYPDDKVLACSYNASLASDMCLEVERIMDTTQYHEVFPESQIVPLGTSMRYKRTSTEFELIPIIDPITNEPVKRFNPVTGEEMGNPQGTYRCAGVEGSFTGKPGDWLIIDDPYKNRTDADSPATRSSILKNYNSTLKTRLKGKGQILIMHTRWHPDDLAANLLALAQSDPDADQWVVLKLPAYLESETDRATLEDMRELDEPLWPSRFPMSVLRSHKAASSRDFSALYQQTPTSAEGSIIKRSQIQFYKEPPSRLTRIIQSWDFTFKDSKKSDFVVGQVWGQFGSNFYLLDQVRDRMGFTDCIKAVKALSAKWPRALLKLIEDKANGPAIIDALKNDLSGIVAVNPEGSKEARVHAISPAFEGMNVWVPDPSIAPWVNDWIEEVVSFPVVTNDDQVDAMSQALDRLWDKSASMIDRLSKL